ncbi:hypothetical protein [Micromonospora sp. NPDC023956]|uniref:hypothetical protein n=1 Tax=Micromonospora sp. NPDC023956 TaxID=3155722 RepID=UPI0033EC953D
MADLDRDLPFRPAAQAPTPTTADTTLLGLCHEVLSKPDMLAGAMALTLFIACLLGSLLAFVTGRYWGFMLFFPGAITLLVWAVRRARREKRRASGGGAGEKRRERTE